MKYCPHCGSEIKDPLFKFCGSCGKPFNQSTGNTHNENQADSPKSLAVCPNCGSSRYEPFHKWCDDCENKPIENKSTTVEYGDQRDQPKQVCPKCASDRYDSFHQWCEDCSDKNITTTVFPQPSKFGKPKLKIILSAIGIFAVIVLIASIWGSSSKRPEHNISTNQSSQIIRPAKRYFESGFYKLIGISKSKLISDIGEPTHIKNGLFIYEDNGWRFIYGFKNDIIHDAIYLELDVNPKDVVSRIEDIMVEFENYNFWRISDFENIKRFSNGTYDIYIFPVKTDNGTYNLGLQAFPKKSN